MSEYFRLKAFKKSWGSVSRTTKSKNEDRSDMYVLCACLLKSKSQIISFGPTDGVLASAWCEYADVRVYLMDR